MFVMAVVVNGGEQQSLYSLTFAMKIGLVRESVRVDLAAYGGRLTTEMLRDIAFAFLDRNVRGVLRFTTEITGASGRRSPPIFNSKRKP